MNFFAENLKVFKKVFVPLFALVIVSSNIEQYLNLEMEGALRSPLGMQPEVYLFGFLSIITSIIFPVILTTTCLYALLNWNELSDNLGAFLKKHLNQMYIETLRSWGKSLLWSLLLVIPGLWKFLMYSMVPYVVTGSKVYDEGKIDALNASTEIVKRHWFKVLVVFFVFHIFLPVLLSTLFDSYRVLWKTPITSLILSGLDTYMLLLSTHILFIIFRSEVRRHDSHV